MCTAALRALRDASPDAHISFLGGSVLKEALSPSDLFDQWVEPCSGSVLKKIKQLRDFEFDEVILFKNSFSCALIAFLAGIGKRIGYFRDGRSWLLTNGLEPPKAGGKFLPHPMSDYYVNLLGCIDINANSRKLELQVDKLSQESMLKKLPIIADRDTPLAVLVPGGAFGTSKRWNPQNFAYVADYLSDKYNANVIISVAPNEKDIADGICRLCKCSPVNLADHPFTLGELKALISKASIVIANDTGPRHIAIAFGRPIVTLFGPNDPNWTISRHWLEIQIITDSKCAPCQKPECPLGKNICMEQITPEKVCQAADELLEKAQYPTKAEHQGVKNGF